MIKRQPPNVMIKLGFVILLTERAQKQRQQRLLKVNCATFDSYLRNHDYLAYSKVIVMRGHFLQLHLKKTHIRRIPVDESKTYFVLKKNLYLFSIVACVHQRS